jgi:hypothetical protein
MYYTVETPETMDEHAPMSLAACVICQRDWSTRDGSALLTRAGFHIGHKKALSILDPPSQNEYGHYADRNLSLCSIDKINILVGAGLSIMQVSTRDFKKHELSSIGH